MRRILSAFILIVFLIVAILFVQKNVYSDELDDISKKIADLQSSLTSSKQATAPFESQLVQMKKQLDDISFRVAGIDADIVTKQKNILKGYQDLGRQKEIFNRTVRAYYIKNYVFSPLLVFLSSKDAQDASRLIAYQKKGEDQDRAIITTIALKVVDLEERKRALEDEQQRLASVKQKLDAQKADVQKLVDGARAYQSTLTSQIAELSAKQQSILNSRLASLNIPRSAGTSARGCSDDRAVNPGFSPRIAFFSYGAPHRNGLNQYGALGRAKEGQNEETILQAYYPNMSLKKDYDQGAQVNVDGFGTFSIEDYVKRIWEVPNSWGDEGGMSALKAQAVAARTYALNSMQRNGHICTTEACQVFRPDPKGGNWDQAVEATKGWVLMDGGNPGFTQYASTHGGYILNLGKFDGRVGTPTSFSEWNDRAYDKESPWFYCDWGSRPEYSKTAWLKPSEVADIVNVILLGRADSSAGKHLYQLDKPNPEGTDTWNEDRVRQELQNKGITPFTNVSDVSVSPDFGGGKTSSVSVSGNTSQSFGGDEFKNWFNLRAPANIQIVGPLFNVEKQ